MEPVQMMMPYSAENEAVLLGAALLVPDAADLVADLGAGSFYVPRHATVARAIARLSAHGSPVDHRTVADMLEQSGEIASIGGARFLGDLMAGTPTLRNGSFYADLVRRDALRRSLIAAARAVESSVITGDDVRLAVALLNEIADGSDMDLLSPTIEPDLKQLPRSA